MVLPQRVPPDREFREHVIHNQGIRMVLYKKQSVCQQFEPSLCYVDLEINGTGVLR